MGGEDKNWPTPVGIEPTRPKDTALAMQRGYHFAMAS